MSDLTTAEQFFYDNAGYGYPTGTDPEEGRVRCAKALAEAEIKLLSGPYFVRWEYDDMPYDGDDDYDGPVWTALLYSVEDRDTPTVLGSLGGVACEGGDPYMRVVQAELALEYIS